MYGKNIANPLDESQTNTSFVEFTHVRPAGRPPGRPPDSTIATVNFAAFSMMLIMRGYRS